MSKTASIIYGQIIGFTSSIFMLFVFLNEAFFKRGVLYIEPNIAIATIEFFVVLTGLAIQGIVMIRTTLSTGNRPGKEGKKGKEPMFYLKERTGYETNNRKVYQ